MLIFNKKRLRRKRFIILFSFIVVTLTGIRAFADFYNPIIVPTVIVPTVTSTPTPVPTSVPTPNISKTIAAINSQLKGKLAGKGELIYNACKAQNPQVNSKFMTAIILLEVGINCDSDLLVKASNVGGLNWYKECGYPIYNKWYIDYSSVGVDESLRQMAFKLSRYYIAEGKTNIVTIGKKYAPPKDKRNGIGGMDNTKWAQNVEWFYKKLVKEEKRHDG